MTAKTATPAKPGIDTKTKRAKLAPRREPYWAAIGKGVYVGVRISPARVESWICRFRDKAGKQKFQALGEFAEYYDARKAAEAWYQGRNGIVEPGRKTVADACSLYVDFQRTNESAANASDAEGRFKRLVYDHSIGAIALDKLQKLDVQRWLHEQVKKADDPDADEESTALAKAKENRSKDSANRNLTALKAALNYAFSIPLVTSNVAWKTVTKFKGTSGGPIGARREGWLHADERKRLLDAMPDDLRTLALALLHIGARPGELASANAADFDRSAGVLNLTGKTGPRKVNLSSAALVFFTEQAKDKIGNAPLLTQADGQRWTAPAWGVAFRDAREAAKLPDAVLYCMRHTYISEAIARGLDVFTVAKLTGTSVAIIQSNYGTITDNIVERLDKVSAFI